MPVGRARQNALSSLIAFMHLFLSHAPFPTGKKIILRMGMREPRSPKAAKVGAGHCRAFRPIQEVPFPHFYCQPLFAPQQPTEANKRKAGENAGVSDFSEEAGARGKRARHGKESVGSSKHQNRNAGDMREVPFFPRRQRARAVAASAAEIEMPSAVVRPPAAVAVAAAPAQAAQALLAGREVPVFVQQV